MTVWAALSADGWLALGTVTLLASYELALAVAQRRYPERLARTAHARLREDWFSAVSSQPGSEILAVQTLRNSLMSATMTASTAVLALAGAVSLAAPSLPAALGGDVVATPRLTVELLVLALLFASLVASVTAVRYYHHASFVGGMPVGSPERARWAGAGSSYVRKAGLLYGWGLRQLILVAPLAAFMLVPAAGPVAALVAVATLVAFDRAPAAGRD